MIDEMKESPLPNDLSKYWSHYGKLEAQSNEIRKDKRHESGMAGREVGFERALADWLIKHRSSWHKSRQPETQLSRISIS